MGFLLSKICSFPGSRPWPPFFKSGWFPSFTIILVGVKIIFQKEAPFLEWWRADFQSDPILPRIRIGNPPLGTR